MKKKLLLLISLFLCLMTLASTAFASEHFKVESSGGQFTISLPKASSSPAGGTMSSALTEVFTKYKGVATLILAVCIITAILCFIWQVTKLGSAGDNQMKRSMAIKGILVTGIVIAAFGSLTLIAALFWNALS